MDELRNFLGQAYNRDITDIDQEVKEFLQTEMKSGILKSSSKESAKSRERSRSKIRTS